ncbi:MAG: MFS transporter, partial [Rhodospirillales bacterium]|nr:MFS transporter [Rhodospirillales bacterium]
MKKPSMWTVIICGALILTLATGLRQTMGLFLKPISLDLEIGREVFGFGIAIQNLLWGLAAPFAGAMADRYGTGRVGVIGGLLYMIGLAVMGLSTGGGTLTFANFFIGIGLGFTGFSAVLGAVGRVTPPEKRSVALGIVTAGGSFGQFAVVPYGHLLLDGWGWQIALFVLAGTAFLMVPLSRGIAGFIGVQNTTGQSMKGALGEAFTHRGYQLMVAGFFVCGFHVAFVATHLPAYLADK